ncbi:aldo/keto reductase [Cyclobacteriaceae bacterium]|nr:aldo/keto reductase [Cyclobacteriaceae bacterium]MDB4605781.1 aldo/keto reductase [Cyclobacteriaceae bacterium]
MVKIALGTAQFGINYGISNEKGIPNDKELKMIFTSARNHGIKYLDTHSAYGNSEERIGTLGNSFFKIVTKFSKVTSNMELRSSLANSLKRLNADFIYGFLAHDPNSLISAPSLWHELLELKRSGKIKKIGYSLYSPEQLEKLMELGCIPEIVQLPYSLLDRKFEGYLPLLKEHNTEIHVRSVFLQGLYLMNPSSLPKKLSSLKESLTNLQKLCKNEKKSVAEIALNFVRVNPYIDQLVIGVESAQQLNENIDLISKQISSPEFFVKLDSINVKDKLLLNPSNW